ncbi:hypothetical protein [Argonema galeatum]|uniref:hypothetical protein n=1 Tax=Argonema galeatum TaxID=2942762 RepID=UPI0020110FA2|nr:hypothetical protein [Argonema galeatum]MCL1465315.1 hypothetical protein [Argonema galeatum A003/A1]
MTLAIDSCQDLRVQLLALSLITPATLLICRMLVYQVRLNCDRKLISHYLIQGSFSWFLVYIYQMPIPPPALLKVSDLKFDRLVAPQILAILII